MQEGYPDKTNHPAYFMIRIQKDDATDEILRKFSFDVMDIPKEAIFWGHQGMAFFLVKLSGLKKVVE